MENVEEKEVQLTAEKSEKERSLLKKLRGHLAFKHHCAPYAIFKDEQLEMLLEVRPKTLEELAGQRGFPLYGRRVGGYGEAIVAVFNRSDQIEDFEFAQYSDGQPVIKLKIKNMDIF